MLTLTGGTMCEVLPSLWQHLTHQRSHNVDVRHPIVPDASWTCPEVGTVDGRTSCSIQCRRRPSLADILPHHNQATPRLPFDCCAAQVTRVQPEPRPAAV